MIRSSKVSTKFANANKQSNLKIFLKEYNRVSRLLVDELWEYESLPKFLSKDVTKKFDTWLSARMLQCIGKQIAGVVRGTKQKQKQRLFVIHKLQSENQTIKANKLQDIYDKTKVTKPNLDSVCPELDARFIKVDLHNNTSFNGWVTVSSIGNKMKLIFPFKKTVHLNRVLEDGKLKNGLRITKNSFTFMIDLPDQPIKSDGTTLGLDIGQTTLYSCSNNVTSVKNKHNHDLNSIQSRLANAKKGSNGSRRSQQHRTNYINWSINQLDLSAVKQLNLENIKHLRRNRKSSRKLSHWTYTDIKRKLESKCEQQGVLVVYVSPTYTSQRCSHCGWVQKSNRKGKNFNCVSCSFAADADINASKNIALRLSPLSDGQRLQQNNRTGFFCRAVGDERIVRHTKKTKRNRS